MRLVELVSRLIAQIPRRARVPLVLLLAFFLALATLFARDARSGDAFDFVRWERTSVANKWLYALGGPFRDDLDGDDAIAQYFALDDYSADEARELENIVEAEIEGRIDKVIAELGIDGRFPLPGSVFPPVDIELASSPRALVISTRDYIERTSTDLLRPDLTLDDAVTLEQSVEEDDTLSALVVSTGGVAAYPAVVKEGRSYVGTVSTAAHEWVHHYLTFYELGFRYNDSSDLRTINETVADIAGDEIADIVIERFGDPTKISEAPAANPATSPTEPAIPAVDRNKVLRDLRFEVDELLADGEIEVAEARMEAVRLELCEAGHCLRRINQAYFAWYGTYAARDDAVDPLGGQLRALREHFGSLEAFLTVIRGAGSRAEVEALLAGSVSGGAAGG
jgi:hypothetical protein